ncbi:hypothetical protein PWT90_10843 [Aphanocladium album]|nr:hypothetical protein PWT90_10843 [Aphanocladium album]
MPPWRGLRAHKYSHVQYFGYYCYFGSCELGETWPTSSTPPGYAMQLSPMHGQGSLCTPEPALPTLSLLYTELLRTPKNSLLTYLRLQGRLDTPAMSLPERAHLMEGGAMDGENVGPTPEEGAIGMSHPAWLENNRAWPFDTQTGEMRYSQDTAASSVVDQSAFLSSYSFLPSGSISTATSFTPDTSAAFFQTSKLPHDTLFPSYHRTCSSVPLGNLRGPAAAVHPPVRSMSAREQYSSATPQFGRRAEATRHRSPSNFHSTVMSRASWAGGNAQPLPSTYQSVPDSREHSGSPTYSSRATDDIVLPMEETEQLGSLQYLDNGGGVAGTPIEASISATIHKNFFMGEKYFTCYRRNYMACNCSFSLSPYYPGVQMHFTPIGGSGSMPIAGFAMCISAVVSAHQHQEVTILQHTPKRDKGPINEPTKQSLGPKKAQNGGTPPHIGGYHEGGQSSRPMYSDIYGMNGCQTLPTEHNFDRIQFKTATANNGERRAGQQCYRLVVELWGDMGVGPPNSPERWVKIAIQKSTEIVVRGRSPGHYQKERRKSQGGSGGGPSPHGNYGGNAGMGDYGTGGMLSGQPNGYGAPGPYDHRGGLYGGGSLRPADLGRRDVAAYSLESRAFDTGRMLPSSFTNPSAYGDPGFYHQNTQAAGVSPLDLLGKPRGDPDMGLLPRPSEPPQRMGQLDGRCSNSGSSSVLPLPSLVTGGYVSSS